MDTDNVEKNDVKKNQNELVLFVDDEQDLLDIGRRMLESLGYSVVTMNSSVEALELFQKDPNQFDAVITDMTMPFIMGDELAREILHIRHDIPVILCTGYSDKVDEQKAIELGIRAYLKKPFKASDLLNSIHQALDQ